MKLLLDEMWPPVIAAELRRRGHDVNTVVERAELRTQPDEVIFAVAQTEGRAVLTENARDFVRLAAECLERGESHAGLILTHHRRFNRSDPRTVGRLVRALDALLSTDPTPGSFVHWLT